MSVTKSKNHRKNNSVRSIPTLTNTMVKQDKINNLVKSNSNISSTLIGLDKEVGTIYSTMDYNKFSFFEANREIKDDKHKRILRKSILSVGQLQNVLCNKNFKIADGQHRYEILKELNMPIRYEVRNDINIQKIQEMQLGRAWGIKDYTHSYTNDGDQRKNATYSLYDEFLNKFKLGHNMTLALVCGTYSNSVPTEHFKAGRLRIDQAQYEKATKEATMLQEFSLYHKGWKKRSFVLAIFSLMRRVKGYNHKNMVAKLARYSKELFEHNKAVHYVENLIEIYNKYLPKEQKLKFIPEEVIGD